MEGSTMVNGGITRWKVTESSHGQMEDNTKENTSTIKRKATEFSIGLTEENMKVNGLMENSMDRERIHLHQARRRKASG